MASKKMLCPDCKHPDGEFTTRVVAVATVNLDLDGSAYNALDMEQDPNEAVGPFYMCTKCGSEYDLDELRISQNGKYKLVLIGEVTAYLKGSKLQHPYKVWLNRGTDDRTVLFIKPGRGTSGMFSWYLSTLLAVDSDEATYKRSAPGDRLSLDSGQDWHVTGMIKIYNKILNEFIVIKEGF